MGGLFETLAAIPDAIFAATRSPRIAFAGVLIFLGAAIGIAIIEANREKPDKTQQRPAAEPERRITKIGKWLLEKE